MLLNKKYMKKDIITWLIAILLTSTMFAQVGVELKGGINSYVDTYSYSKNLINIGIGVNYDFPNEILRARGSFNYGELQNSHIECNYTEDYFNANLDLLINANRVFKLTDNYFVIRPYLGLGYSNYGGDKALNLNVGIVNSIRLSKRFSLLIEVSSHSLVGLENPLGYPEGKTPAFVDALNITYLAGVQFDITKRKPKPQPVTKIIEKHIIQKQPIVNNLCNDCDEFVLPNEHVFFEEGKYKILQSELNAITNIFDFMKNHPETKAECIGSSCSNQGSDKRNLELSVLRAKEVQDKLISMGINPSRLKYRGTGSDTKYSGKDSDVQKRVSFLIYK